MGLDMYLTAEKYLSDYDEDGKNKIGKINELFGIGTAFVWHFADWNGFAKFLETHYGLKNARWVSDEYIDPFDAL